MKVIVKLAPRLLILSGLCSSLCVLAISAVYMDTANRLITARIDSFARDVMSQTQTLGCENKPDSWAFVLKDGTRIDAYDVASLSSLNPSTPAIPELLKQRIRQGAKMVMYDKIIRGKGGDLFMRLAPRGPCSLVRIHWTRNRELRTRGMLSLLVAIAVVMVLTMAAGGLWVIRPLLKRISTLAAATSQVGTPGNELVLPSCAQDELSRIADALELAHQRILKDRERLETKNQALASHLSDVAHDLRTPIASMQLALEQLTSEHPDSPQATAALSDALYLESLAENLRMQTTLQHQLKDLARQQQTQLNEIVQRLASRFGVLAKRKDISLDAFYPDEAVLTDCHPVFIERALANLIENAVRYGHPEGHVAIILEQTKDSFTISVIDDSPGVPEELLEKILQRGFQVQAARQRQEQGQGLGLSITQEICLALNLELKLHPESPHGLRATIRGPIKQA